MAESVVMPKAGISVESCIIGTWQKQLGDTVSIGDILFDYETDKATFECESTTEGTLLAILYQEGDEVPVLLPVCVIGQPGEDVASFMAHVPTHSDASPTGEATSDAAAAAVLDAGPAATLQPVMVAGNDAGVSPRARALASQLNLDLSTAAGSGPHGRIIERDVQAMAAIPGSITMQQSPANASGTLPPSAFHDEPMPRIRQSIAKVMHASLQSTAQLTHHHSFDASAILALRANLKKNGDALGLSGVTLGDMVLYATVYTLKQNPHLNANLLEGDVLRTFSGVHLGVAVDTERGLMVPTVFDADKMSLSELSLKVKELAELCRSGSISPDLLQGGTFTVSNLGNFGVEIFTPIINPPQVGILGVCSAVERPRTGTDGNIELYPSMGLSLTYDHRAVDGAPASRFARDLGRNLENFPMLLAL